MVIAAPILYVLAGALMNSAIRDGFRRHVFLGSILAIGAVVLFCFAYFEHGIAVHGSVRAPAPTVTVTRPVATPVSPAK